MEYGPTKITDDLRFPVEDPLAEALEWVEAVTGFFPDYPHRVEVKDDCVEATVEGVATITFIKET